MRHRCFTVLLFILSALSRGQTELIRNGGFSDSKTGWHYFTGETGTGSFSVSAGRAVLAMSKQSSFDWEHVIGQDRIPLQRNSTYRVFLKARSERIQRIACSFGALRSARPHFVYASSWIDLDTAWREIELFWPNAGQCAVENSTAYFAVYFGRIDGIVEIDTISIRGAPYQPSDPDHFACTDICRRCDVSTADPASLPQGFFVYSHSWVWDRSSPMGLFRSSLSPFMPSLIPNTGNDYPQHIMLTEDGKWISYIDDRTQTAFLIRPDGSCKTRIPIEGPVDIAGIWHSCPSGRHLYYNTREGDRVRIFAIPVNLDGKPVFGPSRLVADLGDEISMLPKHFYGMAGEAIYGRMSKQTISGIVGASGYLTIPDGGTGVAGPQHLYRWGADQDVHIAGCHHALSLDGALAAANTGALGAFGGYRACSPADHKGFYVTGFRRFTDPPLDLHNSMHLFGESIVWCPPEYRHTFAQEVDFYGWRFTNDSRYIAGCQAGTISRFRGFWLVQWRTGTWIPLTPDSITIFGASVAAHFGEYHHSPAGEECPVIPDTAINYPDPFNPWYEVVRPNGGEVFKINELCTVVVRSRRAGEAVLSLEIGPRIFPLPGLDRSIDPRRDSVHVFRMPATLTWFDGGIPVEIDVSTSCARIVMTDYNPTSRYSDESDSCFSIIGQSTTAHRFLAAGMAGRYRRPFIAAPGWKGAGRHALPVEVFGINGRKVVTVIRQNRSSILIVVPR